MKKLKMDLQMFAEGGEGEQPAEPITFASQSEYDSALDKHTSKALETARTKMEAEFRAKLESEKNQAAELAKLSEEDRQQALLDAEKAKFDAERAEFRKEQLFVEKQKQLATIGLPSSHAHRISGETAEEIIADIKAFKEEYDRDLEEAVNKRLASSASDIRDGSRNPSGEDKGSEGSRLAKQTSKPKATSTYFKNN